MYEIKSERAEEYELIRRAQNETAQFAVLYDRYVQRVYRFLLARTEDVAEAEDLTSQTFLTAIDKLPSYKPTGHFITWLFSIARNKQIDNFRKQRRRDVVELDENVVESGLDLMENLIQEERQIALKIILSKLPEKDRELLNLRLAAKLSYAEMGEYLHENEEKVKKSYYRLIEHIKTKVEDGFE